MSSPAQAGPSVPKEKKGLGKVLSRMKTVLRRDKGKVPAGPSEGGADPRYISFVLSSALVLLFTGNLGQ